MTLGRAVVAEKTCLWCKTTWLSTGMYACGPTYIREGHTYHDVHMLGAQLSVQGEDPAAL